MDCTRLRSSSETGGSEGRNEIIAATIGGTFMADIVILCEFCLDPWLAFKKANQNTGNLMEFLLAFFKKLLAISALHRDRVRVLHMALNNLLGSALQLKRARMLHVTLDHFYSNARILIRIKEIQ